MLPTIKGRSMCIACIAHQGSCHWPGDETGKHEAGQGHPSLASARPVTIHPSPPFAELLRALELQQASATAARYAGVAVKVRCEP